MTEKATFGASGKKNVSCWTVLIFNPVSGRDMGAFALTNSAGVYISNSEISPKGTVLYEALCISLYRVPQAVYVNFQLKKS